MAILVLCETCQERFRADAEGEGERAKCPSCHTQFSITKRHIPPYDVFISYASEDQPVARGVCDALEERGIRCWIAPRDCLAGIPYASAIVRGIRECRAMAIVFSDHANRSDQVGREVEIGASEKIPLVRFQVEECELSEEMTFFLSSPHGLDAWTPPLDNHIALLAAALDNLVKPKGPPRKPSIEPGIPLLPGTKYTNAAVLDQDFAEFQARAKSLVKDPLLCERLVLARRAIQEVASLLDRNWERGRHTLGKTDVIPIIAPPNDRRTTPLALRVLHIIVKCLNDTPKPCRIESDEGGVIQEKGALIKRDAGRVEEVSDGSHTWVIDPIDGSRHLMRHLPLFTTTIVLADDRHRGILALIYVPVTGELFFAVRGQDLGAYLNNWDTRLEVSGRAAEEAYAYLEFPNIHTPKREFTANSNSLKQIFKKVYRVRGCGIGSLGMAYVAKGAFDAYLTLSGKTRRCDVLAGALLVENAGGRAQIVDARSPNDGRPASLADVYAIGANPDLYKDLTAIDGISDLFARKENSR